MGSIHLINRKTQYFLGTISVVLCVFIGSIFLAPYYFGGDQLHYNITYYGIQNLSLHDAYELYNARLTSWELSHFIVIWITSGLGIEKNLVMALANSILAYFIMKICYKWRVSLLVSSSICIRNFYMLALYFSAERLKFAFLFFAISIYYVNYRKKFFIFSLLTLASHLQFIILYLGLMLPKFLSEYLKRVKRILVTHMFKIRSELFGEVAFLSIVIYFLVMVGDQLILKYNYHSTIAKDDGAIINMIRVFIFFGMTVLYSKKYKVITLNYIPLMIAIFFLGGHRLNIFAYVLFMSHALVYKRGLNFGVLITSIYFMYKSIGFVNRIIDTGNGY